ncbi:hypothetical protein BS614_04145 [Paenibacillus xylanexedens]|uniref:hypothetical protein n=1 Tax=Paenibacillus xylanexedens TaxID=528191 RepID=UPI0009381FDF|nr:hypothetical protein [Paenibacillus xylanexedens]APO43323.1 hypothetical protein BS614_04145 [Paenibacillus xylanexedens]
MGYRDILDKITKIYPELIDQDIADIIRSTGTQHPFWKKVEKLDDAIKGKMEQTRLTELSKELGLRK